MNGFLDIVIVIVLWTFAWLHLIKQKDVAKTRWVYETTRVASIFWGMVLIWMLYILVTGYSEIILGYKSGNYREVEGIVEDYTKVREGEKFTINGVEFWVSHGITWGYTLSFTKDSVITGNGQHLRIRYLPGNHTIVYIEQMIPEVEDILMGLAAFFGDYIVENLEECWWEDSRYVRHRERYDHPCKQKYGTEYRDMQPLQIVKEVWREQNMNTICSWYNGLFVERRKRRKALSLWDREKEDKIAGNGKVSEWIVTKTVLIPFMEQYKFQSDFNKGNLQDDVFFRRRGKDRQEIWLMRSSNTCEMWVKAVTKSGRELEIQDIREGLSPYDRAEYCLGEIISEGGQYIQTVNQLKEQIADIWIPVLDNEEAYLLQWELTPEMVRREFFDKEELLRKLDRTYGITDRTKEELPGFIKRILKENEDRSLEEFEDTLLGLSVLLGEMAIKEIEGSHWMWDKVRSACLVTYRNEVTGVDPAFALNYAWQRKKPENVDRLCQDLFEGNYIEDRGRGGYDIRKA